jgi:hypothetical protein
MIKSPNGFGIQSPHLAIADKGMDQMRSLERAERLAASGGWLELDFVREPERPNIVTRRLD